MYLRLYSQARPVSLREWCCLHYVCTYTWKREPLARASITRVFTTKMGQYLAREIFTSFLIIAEKNAEKWQPLHSDISSSQDSQTSVPLLFTHELAEVLLCRFSLDLFCSFSWCYWSPAPSFKSFPQSSPKYPPKGKGGGKEEPHVKLPLLKAIRPDAISLYPYHFLVFWSCVPIGL